MNEEQMWFAANAVEYVDFLHDKTTVRKGSKKFAPVLAKEIPIYGPLFTPPSYVHDIRRSKSPNISPASTYLKPLHVVHPFYYPELAQCPCGSKDIRWRGWTATGYREVHGVSREETAIGLQLRCLTCKDSDSEGQDDNEEKAQTSFSLTSTKYWEKKHHWEIPRKCSCSDKIWCTNLATHFPLHRRSASFLPTHCCNSGTL